jgi:hypothetical protein
MFVSKQIQKKAQKDLNNLLNEGQDGKFKMQVIATGGKLIIVEWTINVLLNNLKKPAGIMMIAKK